MLLFFSTTNLLGYKQINNVCEVVIWDKQKSRTHKHRHGHSHTYVHAWTHTHTYKQTYTPLLYCNISVFVSKSTHKVLVGHFWEQAIGLTPKPCLKLCSIVILQCRNPCYIYLFIHCPPQAKHRKAKQEETKGLHLLHRPQRKAKLKSA